MPPRRRRETEVERAHGHCADVLMNDFGIPKAMRKKVCENVAKVWKQNTMIHCLIIASVRCYQPHAATRKLESFLRKHATREQKHRNHAAPRQSATFDLQGAHHLPVPPYSD